MLMSKFPSALALVLLAGSLTACHLSPPSSGPIPKAPVQASPMLLPASLDISQATNQQESDPLNLTASQRQQFATISQEAMKNDRSADLQRLLTAAQVDVAALRNALSQSESDITQSVNLQVRMRNILTPQQRQTLVQSYQQSSQTSEGSMSESQLQEAQKQLSLTADQMRLLSAMNDAMKRHTEANRAPLRNAQIALVNTGEGEQFRQALLAANRSQPLDAMIAYFTSLSQAQRQKLFTNSSGSTSGS
ncbi:hypothetical protein D3C72_127240 [compost metagenome]